MSYNSKYTGQQVETLLDSIAGKQEAISDLDTIRGGALKGATALQSVPDEYITETELSSKGYATTSDLEEKVDKVDGKQLSTEDFTTALKSKLESLSNYDDTEISNAVSGLQTQLNTLVSGNADDAINSFNEIIAFLDGVKDTQDLSSIIASIEQQIAGKMDKITLATVATSGSYNDLSNKPTIPAEQVNADWNATSGKAQILNKPTIPSAVTESTVSGWGFTKNTGTYSKPSSGIPKTDLASAVQTSLGKADTALQSHQDISGKQDKLVSGTNIKTINNTSILGSGNITISGGGSGTITGVSANGTSIATSGVADIPAASTSVYGVTKLTSSTSSTSTTLAATASAVKSAYDLANSYKGTVTGVKINGTTKSPSSGTVDVGNVVTSVKVNGTTYTPSSGVVDLGTISGGGTSGGGGSYAGNYPIFDKGTILTGTVLPLQPNTYTKVRMDSGLIDYLVVYFETPTDESIVNEYVLQIDLYDDMDMGSEPIIEIEEEIIWANGDIPVFGSTGTVVMSFVNNLGVYTTFPA